MNEQRAVASYGEMVVRQFRRSRLAMVALTLVVLLFGMAGLAPFLASHAPLLQRSPDRPLSSPVLSDFQKADVFWAGLLVIAGGVLGARRRVKRQSGADDERRRRNLSRVHQGGVLAFLLLLCWLPFHPFRLPADPWTDLYARETVAGEWYLRTPLHWNAILSDRESFRATPSAAHPFGTDAAGRDVLARVIYGARVSLVLGFVSMSIALVIGVTIGGLAGYFGGWVDLLFSRLIEVVMCFPTLFLILIVSAYIPHGLVPLMILIGLLGWTTVARLTRGEFLRLKNQEFVLAARALGAGPWRIMVHHLLPNAMGPILVAATFGVAGAMLVEASLSFLDLGVQDPTPSWGADLGRVRAEIGYAPWGVIAPGGFLFLAVCSYNLIGEGLRDALDPRLRR